MYELIYPAICTFIDAEKAMAIGPKVSIIIPIITFIQWVSWEVRKLGFGLNF